MPQFDLAGTYRVNWENISAGLTFFAIGLFQKVMIADSLAPLADGVFSAAHEGVRIMFFEAWIGALAYTFQLYFDFSGYSDMAIGLALVFNVRLPLNFDSPYRSTSIIDFWRRWHMSLSTFLRDYLYISLGGNRHGVVRRHANLMITMLLGGLWHGANWTFVAWGGLHGVLLVVNHAWRAFSARFRLPRMGSSWFWSSAAWALTFACVVVAWVFFRAGTFQDAQTLLAGMAGLNGLSLPWQLENSAKLVTEWLSWLPVSIHYFGIAPNTGRSVTTILGLLLFASSIAVLLPNSQSLLAWNDPASRRARQVANGHAFTWAPTYPWMFFTGTLLAVSFLSLSGESKFLYFQF